ncbi:MAG: hypothetical protein E7374_01830 [Clostridiales bacterium]|nr:hypothetical protein [Clostridiales bacterium]
MKNKTIILSSPENSINQNARGIISLYIEDDLLKCKLRIYSLAKLNPGVKIGIYHRDQVYKSNLLDKGGQYESSLVGSFNMDEDFYVAIVDTSSNEILLKGGTYSGYYFNMDFSENTLPTDTEEVKEECSSCPDCANCKYKEFFYANQQADNTIAETHSQEEQKIETHEYSEIDNKKTEELQTKDSLETNEKENKKTILTSLIPQFEYVFENYPLDEEIMKLVENSKFVRIQENENSFCIGAIYENDQIKYICYAVKCDYNSKVPEELGEHYQWLPIDVDDPLSEGFYIVYQDSQDLKIIEV